MDSSPTDCIFDLPPMALLLGWRDTYTDPTMVQYAGACALCMLRIYVHYEPHFDNKFLPSKRSFVVGYHGTEKPLR
jgi:hypothetical protein